ncbi:MAG: hypothetical protein LC631_03485 [Desulfovibrionales bacterium]|nr:hypothetical protein [Desulfovibrionales bacterium]
MLSFRILDFFIALLYFTGALSFLLGLIYSSKKTQDRAVILTIAGFGLHSMDLFLKYILGIGEILTQSQFYISLMAWSFLLIYFFLWWKLKLKFLSIAAAPLALLLFSGSLAISPSTCILWVCCQDLSGLLSPGKLYSPGTPKKS